MTTTRTPAQPVRAVARARVSEIDDLVVRGSAPRDDQRDQDETKADAEKSGAPPGGAGNGMNHEDLLDWDDQG